MLDIKYRSFVGWYPVPHRYGFTIGELANYLVGTGQLTADITVVPMTGYRRDMWWNDTGLGWVNPSPNIRSGDAALLYSECFMDPNVKGAVPKIVHFWRWLNGGE